MPEIEFVGADTGGEADDDVLDTGPHRPWPRWVWLVAGLLAVAAALALVVSSRAQDKPSATPSASVSASGAVPVPAQLAPQITALTSDRTSLYWLAGSRLYRGGPVGRPALSAAVSPLVDDFVETQLVPDAAEQTVWLVTRGSTDVAGSSGTVQGFATADLSRSTTVSAPSLIDGAAAFNGALYVLSDGRLLRATARDRRFVPIARIGAHARGLVAAADGLWFVEGGNGSAVGRWTPGGGVRNPAVLDVTDSSLAVVGDDVFVAGTRKGRDVLDTLYPAGGGVDLRAIPTGVTGDLQLVAAGQRSLIVLGDGPRGLELSCVETARLERPGTGVRVLAGAVSAHVAVLQHDVFQAVGSVVRPVTFSAGTCPG